MQRASLGKYFSDRNLSTVWRELKGKQFKINDEYTVAYDSPTGRAYIGVAKKPLQAAKGFGYQGVLLQTDNREFIQCHVCGLWFKKLGPSHLATHQLTKDSYQEKFGLYKGTALVSDATSYRYEQSGLKKVLKYPETNEIMLAKARVGAAAKNLLRNHKLSDKVEHQNRYAICEQQLGFRLVEYVKQYHALPSRSSKSDGSKIAKALYRRYGSLSDGFKHYGLPVQHRNGTTVELIAPDQKQLFYNYNQEYDRERVYAWIQAHCPNLKEGLNVFSDYLEVPQPVQQTL